MKNPKESYEAPELSVYSVTLHQVIATSPSDVEPTAPSGWGWEDEKEI